MVVLISLKGTRVDDGHKAQVFIGCNGGLLQEREQYLPLSAPNQINSLSTKLWGHTFENLSICCVPNDCRTFKVKCVLHANKLNNCLTISRLTIDNKPVPLSLRPHEHTFNQHSIKHYHHMKRTCLSTFYTPIYQNLVLFKQTWGEF